ncbi:hypothetical protein [Chryseobacterium phocaeense]|uniref:hypothetical protein n=1 Tax=Chryseobacterium phocaeense TaxID=1816690 RepID=UPI0009BB5327|nr:hypothetical protein [Chryseobacterium phocaeense]
MKKFLDEVFKPYFFATFLIILAAYLKIDENIKSLTNWFSDNTNSFINFFSRQLSLWQIIICFGIAYLISRIYKSFASKNSKQERKMLKAIKVFPKYHEANFDTGDRFLIKFKLSVLDEEYIFDKLTPYCSNCNPSPIMMSKYGYGDFICSCGRNLNYEHLKHIKSRILTEVEKREN